MKYYAIKRPDGTWIMERPRARKIDAWRVAFMGDSDLFRLGESIIGIRVAATTDRIWIRRAERRGYRCVEVCGFEEVKA